MPITLSNQGRVYAARESAVAPAADASTANAPLVDAPASDASAAPAQPARRVGAERDAIDLDRLVAIGQAHQNRFLFATVARRASGTAMKPALIVTGVLVLWVVGFVVYANHDRPELIDDPVVSKAAESACATSGSKRMRQRRAGERCR